MARARSKHEVDSNRAVWRQSVAVLLLVMTASSLAACGGDGGATDSGATGGVPSGTNTATLEWDAVTNPSPPSGYRVYVGIISGTYVQSVDVGLATTYTVTGLGSGTYYFAATAYDASMNESAYSNQISTTFP
jgi:hypothetical protein